MSESDDLDAEVRDWLARQRDDDQDHDPVEEAKKERIERLRAQRATDPEEFKRFNGGHWWQQAERNLDEAVEVPRWYYERFGTPPSERSTPDDVPVESGPVPPEVDWSDLRAYYCRLCTTECINYVESEAAQQDKCRRCLTGKWPERPKRAARGEVHHDESGTPAFPAEGDNQDRRGTTGPDFPGFDQ